MIKPRDMRLEKKLNKNAFRQCCLNRRNLIEVFVYASGKTASTSLFDSFCNLGFGSIHTHGERYFEKVNKQGNSLEFSLKDLIMLCSEKQDQVFVIDVFREPISRKMSAFFQHLTRLPFIKERLPDREAASIKLPDFFQYVTRIPFIQERLPYSIKRLARHFESNIDELINLFNDYYLLQSENYYGFEEYHRLGFKPDNIDFNRIDKVAVQKERNINFIIVRFDDINYWEGIFSNLGFSEFKLMQSNDTNEKALGRLYQGFRENLFLDKEKLDRIYLDSHRKYLELFYTDQELENQYLKWKAVCRP